MRSLIDACRVPDTVPLGVKGLWEIRRQPAPAHAGLNSLMARTWIGPYPHVTALLKTTFATLHCDQGDVVMEDSERELKRHLPILLAAKGRVLVSGLGLGCVVRGLLAKPGVTHIDVVEIDSTILNLIGPEFDGNPRVALHQGDALTYRWPAGKTWDYAWHDVHADEALDLHLLHARLIQRYRARCKQQGAWMLCRDIKLIWPFPLLGGGRYNRRSP